MVATSRHRIGARTWRLLLAAAVLCSVVACSGADDRDDRATQTTRHEREAPSTEATTPVTAGRYDAPTGPVPTDLPGIQAEIETSVHPPDLLNIGEGSGQGAGLMFVYLALGREHIADQLLARYGKILRVAIGDEPWPLAEEAKQFDNCSDPLPAGDKVKGLSATVKAMKTKVEYGERVDGTVVLTNATGEPVTFFWGGSGIDGYLVEPGTDEPVGTLTGPDTLQAAATAAPAGGKSKPVRVHAGVYSCTPEVHTAVPPGRYELVSVLHLMDGPTIRSTPVEIVVSSP